MTDPTPNPMLDLVGHLEEAVEEAIGYAERIWRLAASEQGSPLPVT